MVRLNRIYTKTGDAGETGLASGPRRSKADLRLEAIGTVDELNAVLGLVRLHADGDLGDKLARIQNELFDLGAELATPETGEPLGYEPLKILESQVERLEAEIDRMNERLAPLKSFVLPAGSPAATHLHHARTVARRAERLMVALSAKEGEAVAPSALRYVNRLSDHLFVAARIANDEGRAEVLWVPGGSR
ncbi:cob(I)yrinic acid a,c-diamide adenosyltransferase [Aurantimonas sp. VKM B-3413]|uniref:cob(I)yrinic acid a,c-diamide adenosyltransferase n=1 Tax=Aurantimonas sp. VKM B-3413 TaxID=2779401 RepID=UPI001E6412D0|nr:cob(I)yrinic acid a,c-diamide adenosyltransferase [Aurantimonas sp. VKM B-3413]MCB8837382.1 cob(I)yrinic acid a,c-diamide adenosyltransferase [Aurantimonas sp. VKM B-3413]